MLTRCQFPSHVNLSCCLWRSLNNESGHPWIALERIYCSKLGHQAASCSSCVEPPTPPLSTSTGSLADGISRSLAFGPSTLVLLAYISICFTRCSNRRIALAVRQWCYSATKWSWGPRIHHYPSRKFCGSSTKSLDVWIICNVYVSSDGSFPLWPHDTQNLIGYKVQRFWLAQTLRNRSQLYAAPFLALEESCSWSKLEGSCLGSIIRNNYLNGPLVQNGPAGNPQVCPFLLFSLPNWLSHHWNPCLPKYVPQTLNCLAPAPHRMFSLLGTKLSGREDCCQAGQLLPWGDL